MISQISISAPLELDETSSLIFLKILFVFGRIVSNDHLKTLNGFIVMLRCIVFVLTSQQETLSSHYAVDGKIVKLLPKVVLN